MTVVPAAVAALLALSTLVAGSRDFAGDNGLLLPSESSMFFSPGGAAADDTSGVRWAVLIAGSDGYWNYRHQVILFASIPSFYLDYM